MLLIYILSIYNIYSIYIYYISIYLYLTAWKKMTLRYIYIIASLVHTLFLIRSYTVFGYGFIDREYHKIYFTDYFFTFYGQQITHFWFVYVWYKSFFKFLFLNRQRITQFFCLILTNTSSFISVAFSVIIQPSDGVTSFNT